MATIASSCASMPTVPRLFSFSTQTAKSPTKSQAHNVDIRICDPAGSREVCRPLVRRCQVAAGWASAIFSRPKLEFDKPFRGTRLLVASPHDTARVLCISCQPILRLGPEPELLIVYGGFDVREIHGRHLARRPEFLAFIYPLSNAEDLKKIIGTIDR